MADEAGSRSELQLTVKHCSVDPETGIGKIHNKSATTVSPAIDLADPTIRARKTLQ